MVQYTVAPGDTLSKISQMYYGNPGYYNDIAAANPQVSDPNLIVIGETLIIPGTPLEGPFRPGEATMLAPSAGGAGAPSPAPTPAMPPRAGDGTPGSPDLVQPTSPDSTAPTMTKAALVVFVGAAAFLGYLVMQNLAKKGVIAKANPRRKRKNSRKKRPEDFQESEDGDEEE